MAVDLLQQIKFPSRRSNKRASWLPVYIEPVVGSGERICIGVAVKAGSEHLVVPVPALERLQCVYGDAAAALVYGASLTLRALGVQLSTTELQELRGRLPVEGVFLGEPRVGAGETLEDIARTALLQSASLVDKAVEDEETLEVAERSANSTQRLERLVQEQVISARPELRVGFSRKFKVTAGARPMRVGFVGRKLAANFGLLFPGSLSTLVSNAKAKLWDLEQLRAGSVSGLVHDAQSMSFELLVHRIRREDPQYSDRQVRAVEEAVEELETEADKVAVRCRPMTSPDEIAGFVLEQEAA